MPHLIERDPQTREEWQEAADLASVHLLIVASREYGLTLGGPQIDEARCSQIIDRARAMQIRPRRAVVKATLTEIIRASAKAGQGS